MSSISPAIKTKRSRVVLDSDDEQPDPTIYKRGTIWHEDGDVIVQAHRTQFRVHRKVLVSASVFFEGMLFVIPKSRKSFIDNRPVLRVPDSEEEWEAFLRYIYFSRESRSKIDLVNPYTSAEHLASVMRLAAKYRSVKICEQAFASFRAHVPYYIDQCNLLYENGHQVNEYSWCVGQELQVLKVALEFRTQTILPPAYYLCIISNDMFTAFDQFDDLTVDTKRTLLVGREKIHAALTKHTLEWLMGDGLPCKSCYTPDLCEVSRRTWGKKIAAALPARILSSLDIWDMKELPSFCTRCEGAVRDAHKSGHDTLWVSLPLYFGLPDWEDLEP